MHVQQSREKWIIFIAIIIIIYYTLESVGFMFINSSPVYCKDRLTIVMIVIALIVLILKRQCSIVCYVFVPVILLL